MNSPSPRIIDYAPNGWQDIGILNQRNPKYFALDRTFTIPLEFVEDGAQILKDIFYKKGTEEKLYLMIAKQQLYFDDTHYGFYYTLLFKGEVDFTQFSHEGPKVTVNIMEGGMAKVIKNNESTTYEVPIDNNEEIAIKMTGILLKQNAAYIVAGGEYIGTVLPNHYVPIGFVNSEGTAVGIEYNSQGLSETDPYFIRNNSDIDRVLRELKGSVKFRIKYAPLLYRFFIRRKLEDGTLQNLFTQEIVPVIDQVYEIPFDLLSVSLPAKSQLFIQAQYLGDVSPPNLVNLKMDYFETTITVGFDFTYRTTYVKALRPKRVLKNVLEKMNEGPVNLQSNILDTYRTIAVTCGDALRGIGGAKIKTSLNDWWQSYNTVLSLGLGVINGVVKVEGKESFVDYSAPIQLGGCKELKLGPALDYMFNQLKIGYPEQNYLDVNGKQEFNNTHVYTAPVSVSKVLEMVSSYRADCYGAEFLRINTEGKTTTDDSADNDVFMLHITDTPIEDPNGPAGIPIYELDRSLNQYATGLLERDTVFNLYLSPKQCLYRNGRYLRSCFYKQDTKYLRFQTTEKNSSLAVAPPSGRAVVESADVEIAQLGVRLFVPVLLEFTTQVPVNLLELLAANPMEAFNTTYVTANIAGIPVKAGINPENNQAQAYQLLAGPDTDLTQLIEIFE